MRTTVRLDDELLKEAKVVAASSGRTLTEVIEESLRETFARRRMQLKHRPIKLHTFKGGGGLRPGVDLDNNAALLDLLEAPDAPP